MRYPSVKTLLQITGGDREVALAVRKVLDGRTELKDQWGRPLPKHTRLLNEEKLRTVNRMIDGMHGVEYVRFECFRDDESWGPETGFEYLNTGDAYVATLVLVSSRFFRVTSWADMLEAHERKCSKCKRLLARGMT